MSVYAADTSVSPEKSRNEIERTLTRYGATSFMFGMQGGKALIMFELAGRRIRFILEFADPGEEQFQLDGKGKKRTPERVHEAWEQSTRQKWRALALLIKAKLEFVHMGAVSIEEEFLAHIMLPDGQSVGAWMAPQIEKAYKTAKMPAMLALTGA